MQFQINLPKALLCSCPVPAHKTLKGSLLPAELNPKSPGWRCRPCAISLSSLMKRAHTYAPTTAQVSAYLYPAAKTPSPVCLYASQPPLTHKPSFKEVCFFWQISLVWLLSLMRLCLDGRVSPIRLCLRHRLCPWTLLVLTSPM